ncbi:MAG: DUF1275 domain-containing protein [Ruminococcaceae bacterium]|nr:DUF1275 domain-containing protein [Oscillospiraceae bacterium]
MSDKFRSAVFIILSGGFQDAYTYCCRGGVFANAQTGNIVLMSSALFRGDWGAVVKYLVPVLSFLLGIAVAELVHVHYRRQEKIHWRQIVLIEEIILLFIVGFIPEYLDPLANALVSFVCALQVQTFHKIHGQPYASTMCIGNMRSGMESLCAWFRSRDRETLVRALTYFGVIGVFAVGAGLGSVLSTMTGQGTIWVCCGLLSVSFGMMFIHEQQEHDNNR